MAYEVKPKGCSQPGCTRTFKPHQWGAIKAHDEGWFLEKSGKAWCPDHNPPWVAEWRARQNRERGEE